MQISLLQSILLIV